MALCRRKEIMEEVDIASVTKRSVRGVFALTSRTFAIQIITFLSNFLLTIFLSPQIFGIYYVVSAVIAFLSYFSDIGLAAALIQKKETPTEDDLKTTFTIQQILVISLVVIALVLSQSISSFYRLRSDGVILFQALCIAFFLSSLKTIPSIILERSLKFEKLVLPQIVESLVFSVTSVVLAINGFNLTSFTIAVLARGILGVIVMYMVQPWRISIGFSRKSASSLLSFGIPFQANSLLALVKDDLLTVYLGKVLPLAQVGFIGFAQKWAFTPLRLIMDNIIRITFPSFSRLQEEKKILANALEKAIFAASFLIFPSLAGLVILFPYFINIIPKYSKWEPALLSLGFFAVNAAFSSVSTPLTNVLNATGKIKTTLYLMIFWTISTWVLTVFGVLYFGFNAVAVVSAVVSVSAIFVVFIVKRTIDFNIFRAIVNPLMATILMSLILYPLSSMFIKGVPSLLLMIVIGAVIYFIVMFALAKKQIIADVRMIRENLQK